MDFSSTSGDPFAGLPPLPSMRVRDFAKMVGMSDTQIMPLPRPSRFQSDDDDDYEDDNFSNESDEDYIPSTRKRANLSGVQTPEPPKQTIDGRNADNSDLDSTLLSSPEPSSLDSDEEDQLDFQKRGIVTRNTDFNINVVFPSLIDIAEARALQDEEDERNKNPVKNRKRAARMAFKYDYDVIPGTAEPKIYKTAEEKKMERKGKTCALPPRKKRQYRWKDEDVKNKQWLRDEIAKRRADAEEAAKAERNGDDFY